MVLYAQSLQTHPGEKLEIPAELGKKGLVFAQSYLIIPSSGEKWHNSQVVAVEFIAIEKSGSFRSALQEESVPNHRCKEGVVAESGASNGGASIDSKKLTWFLLVTRGDDRPGLPHCPFAVVTGGVQSQDCPRKVPGGRGCKVAVLGGKKPFQRNLGRAGT